MSEVEFSGGELSGRGYRHLAIQDRNTASQEYLCVHFGDVPVQERQRVRRQLEEYCEGW